MEQEKLSERYNDLLDSDYGWWREHVKICDISELLGKIIVHIEGAEEDSERVYIKCSDGSIYVMYHEQDCCESVSVNDICGDISLLLNTPITQAEAVTKSEDDEGVDAPLEKWDEDSYTWTFYHLATIKEYVTLRWYGTSNGYYSEEVTFAKIEE